MKILKKISVLGVIIALFFTACAVKDLTQKEASEKLDRLVKRIKWTENYTKRKAAVEIDEKIDVSDTLPDIKKFGFSVDPLDTANAETVEIFVSTEKSGKGTDGWINDIGVGFNNSNITISNGKKALVRIRSIASGTAAQYIASGKYMPDAISPSNDLWIKYIEGYGVKTMSIAERLVGNVAGIVMTTKSVEDLKKKYGDAGIKNIVTSVVQGEIGMGYTNPFASSTGLNLLVTVLYQFANGSEEKMLSDEVKSAFEAFQIGVPFIAMTTMQMRDSVQKGGSLDAFVLEYQTYVNTKELKSGYEFIPFGYRHDNPLYGVGTLTKEKIEVLKKFADYVRQPNIQKSAERFGFNLLEDYKGDLKSLSGKTVILSQKLWKEKKDSGKQIIAVFLCDVSGSMSGERISKLQHALVEGSKFINPNNSIGLATFHHDVTVILPVKKFDLNQQSSFRAAVEDMVAGGSTAMYSGIAVSLKMLVDEKIKNPDAKPMLFVLTDGETNTGIKLTSVESIIRGTKIPIYTIGYDANISVLKSVSSINEAASINADSNDVVYQIGALLNTEM